jgi:hypothetical protein
MMMSSPSHVFSCHHTSLVDAPSVTHTHTQTDEPTKNKVLRIRMLIDKFNGAAVHILEIRMYWKMSLCSDEVEERLSKPLLMHAVSLPLYIYGLSVGLRPCQHNPLTSACALTQQLSHILGFRWVRHDLRGANFIDKSQ